MLSVPPVTAARASGDRFSKYCLIVALADAFVCQKQTNALVARPALLGGQNIQGISLKSLRLSNLRYAYPGNPDNALDQVSFDWHTGELVILVGASGSGKSTLGRLLKGLLQQESGQIELIENGKTKQLTASGLLDLVGWTDAQPERQIFAATVEEEIGFALVNRGIRGDALSAAVRNAMLKVCLDPDRFLERDPLTLSGGEKRRAALASTIVVPSSFLIFDEPEAGLDDEGTAMVAGLIGVLRQNDIGVMVISHDPASIWQSADRILAMERGKLVAEFNQESIDWQRLTDWLESGDKTQ